jgi:hypothetical protein
MMSNQKNLLVAHLRITKQQYVFIIISCVVALAWIFLPEVNSSNVGCYDKLLGNVLDYQIFNKVQFYYFLTGNFILLFLKRRLNVIRFVLIELLLIIPVLIELYVYICSY